ncbi:MAG: hypothetical protein ACRCXL_12140 [Dermatophilaceae bacterium]
MFGTDRLVEEAAALDDGFDHGVLAAMIDMLSRYSDTDLALDPAVTDITALRQFFAEWAAELRSS